MFNSLFRILRVIARPLIFRKWKSCGNGVKFDPLTSEFSYGRISIGNGTFIGPRAYFRTTHSYINIGAHVLFGPNVMILGGNHIFDIPGQLMAEITKGPTHIDPDVNIKDDVWIGAGAIILAGVTINEGAIVAAGTIVSSDVASYEIHGGVPNKKIRNRFTKEDLIEHKRLRGS